ncbi:MAG: hypothetical protein WBA45_01955 [Microthrixaceae bacterium]
MELEHDLVISPVNHPGPQVRRIGLDLSDPYVEQCWSAVVGPSATLLLRRLPKLWQHQVPAELPAEELSRSLGLGTGTGPNSRLASTLDRLVRFGLARPGQAGGFDVYLEVAPLQDRQLDRVPEWTRTTHERLFSAHVERFDGVAEQSPKVAATSDLGQYRQRVSQAAVASNGTRPSGCEPHAPSRLPRNSAPSGDARRFGTAGLARTH